MEKQISAVEWLENEFKEVHKMFGGIDTNWIKRFEQAKQMEKEQIIEAYNEGQNTPYEYSESNDVNWYDGNNYYKETYEQDKQR